MSRANRLYNIQESIQSHIKDYPVDLKKIIVNACGDDLEKIVKSLLKDLKKKEAINEN